MTNVIEYNNVWATFKGPNLMQAKALLRYRAKGYVFSRAYKLGVWDGWVNLIGRSSGFPAGLVPWLVARLSLEGIKFEVQDVRPPAPKPILFLDLQNSTEFRPHQAEAIAAGMAKERGIIHHPTAAGKTEVMIELNRLIGQPSLVLVHRKDLLYQTAERFKKTLNVGEDVIGIIGDGQWAPKAITIATFQTLARRLKEKDEAVKLWLRSAIGQVHVDEAHHLPAKTYEEVMTQLVTARHRIGYSATPDKEGDLETMFKVSAHLGPTIHRARGIDLIDKGHLVPVDVFMVRMPPSNVSFKTYADAVQFGLVENVTRNQMIGDIARKCSAGGRSGPVVILVERISHGERLAWELGTEFVSGSSSTAVRQRAWTRLKNGSLNLLVTSKIADEGLDIPPLSYLILAGGGKAPHVTIQRVGRGMRTSEGKENLFVFDFLDTGKFLSAHSRARGRTYRTQDAYTVQDVDLEEIL